MQDSRAMDLSSSAEYTFNRETESTNSSTNAVLSILSNADSMRDAAKGSCILQTNLSKIVYCLQVYICLILFGLYVFLFQRIKAVRVQIKGLECLVKA